MQPLNKQHVYFPNLDGLRFIGALFILMLHVEGIKYKHGQQGIAWIRHFLPGGGPAVSLFFVLSGFLITYLLLREKKDSGNIHLKKFYVRRILRIWPLFYLIGLIGFILMPYMERYFYYHYSRGIYYFWFCPLLYVFFLPPLVGSQALGATWSVRVEEAFYLVWPWLLRRFKNYYKVFIVVIISVIAVRNIGLYSLQNIRGYRYIIVFRNIFKDYRVSCMALGGMGAYLYIEEKQKILSFLYQKNVQWLIYCIILLMLLFRIHIPLINNEIYSFIFAIIVLNLATNPQSVIRLEHKWMNYFGKVSYGIYLYNPMMRIFCMEGILHYYHHNITGWKMNLLLYASVIITTLAVSALSYEFFEKSFLKLKKYFNYSSSSQKSTMVK